MSSVQEKFTYSFEECPSQETIVEYLKQYYNVITPAARAGYVKIFIRLKSSVFYKVANEVRPAKNVGLTAAKQAKKVDGVGYYRVGRCDHDFVGIDYIEVSHEFEPGRVVKKRLPEGCFNWINSVYARSDPIVVVEVKNKDLDLDHLVLDLEFDRIYKIIEKHPVLYCDHDSDRDGIPMFYSETVDALSKEIPDKETLDVLLQSKYSNRVYSSFLGMAFVDTVENRKAVVRTLAALMNSDVYVTGARLRPLHYIYDRQNVSKLKEIDHFYGKYIEFELFYWVDQDEGGDGEDKKNFIQSLLGQSIESGELSYKNLGKANDVLTRVVKTDEVIPYATDADVIDFMEKIVNDVKSYRKPIQQVADDGFVSVGKKSRGSRR